MATVELDFVTDDVESEIAELIDGTAITWQQIGAVCCGCSPLIRFVGQQNEIDLLVNRYDNT